MQERVQRRLAAILAADVVGYSALMQHAEEATYAEIGRLRREVVEPSFGRDFATRASAILLDARQPSWRNARQILIGSASLLN